MESPKNKDHLQAKGALAILHANNPNAKADALQRAADRLTSIQKGRQTEVADPFNLEHLRPPPEQTVTKHEDFKHGDQVCLCGVHYRIQKTTRRDLVLRVLKDWEIQR